MKQKKRLYTEVEPIFFQIHEAAESAVLRLDNLIELSRTERLSSDKTNWLSHEAYYLWSTPFRLMTPLILFRIMKRKNMTFVDFSIDEKVRQKYQISKLYYFSFLHDLRIAEQDPKVTYDPFQEDASKQIQNPACYRRQALPTGSLDQAIETLIVEENNVLRPCNYGEYESLLRGDNIKRRLILEEVVSLYRDFTFARRPVLGRLIIAQSVMLRYLMKTYVNGVIDDEGAYIAQSIDKLGSAGDFKLMKMIIN